MAAAHDTRRRSRPFFVTETGNQLRRLPKALPCPNCDATEVSIELQIAEEPYAFTCWGECQQCHTKGPVTTRIVGFVGHTISVEFEASGLWNELSEECMAGIQDRRLPASIAEKFESIWRRISRSDRQRN